jgi:hypothetical protein
MEARLKAFARVTHPREARFAGMVALTLLAAAAYLADAVQLERLAGTGHRPVDRKALELRIQSGDLQSREAEWYHPATRQESGEVSR